jgi:hypothetical protein
MSALREDQGFRRATAADPVPCAATRHQNGNSSPLVPLRFQTYRKRDEKSSPLSPNPRKERDYPMCFSADFWFFFEAPLYNKKAFAKGLRMSAARTICA